ncbi:MAG: Toxin-antitoxin system toxin component, PIN family [Candidatus Amesbacteria bacterium GW2011_GWA2_47_11b]|uniref:Toxin-antitoxin system toxin component, PIN family n=3 Tax=Candidatus Amesiibacteriota TaxID=1752730 RepID=A0A0G1SJN0_9BACT|nr:MAG: Toxin-antitoxin system toxin component, PIN family [Microgenomates group bacterium GW2011_GWC1_46_20]KKU57065.1 MAG: Toxin-antitoxin system toxin component, PIN family [Candidatus Amesbacteria bacterium GW2011_GWA2_47_11b]KKU69684.1 MAG: Toxin-antitoxin system toxin component, PIN family [Candidatus Amesbacteria bacterium GW2011_GWA1_47_20]KKU83288.1 MAG: Toxin-antitoxin system toxin component, PIN family [Candidatus Amesbacteria bacterium GW2011_GWC2_47_8]
MAGKRIRVVLDTNVLVSAIVFGGTPKKILDIVLIGKLVGVTTVALMAELSEVVHKKFPFRDADLEYFEEQMKVDFEIVRPRKVLSAVRDVGDNKVLEGAVEGECEYIVTGDEDLLILGNYKGIKIVTPAEFMRTEEKAWRG